MQSISISCARLTAALVMMMAACAPADDGGGGGPIKDSPDAMPAHPPRNSCAPGQPPCPGDTECVDFGSFGDQVCAQLCTQSSDCGGDLVCVPDQNGKGVCATAEWGGVAGIYPEYLCHDENACNTIWDDNENGCRAYYNACLAGLTSQQVTTWVNDVHACLNNNTSCSSAFSCIQQTVPWC